MALNVRNPEAEKLVRELAKQTGGGDRGNSQGCRRTFAARQSPACCAVVRGGYQKYSTDSASHPLSLEAHDMSCASHPWTAVQKSKFSIMMSEGFRVDGN